MLWRILQTEEENTANASKANNSYSDVPDGHWAYEAIEQLRARRIMHGVGEGQFQPDRPMTRAEFAALAVRWKQLKPAAAHHYKDVEGHWAENDISALTNSDIAGGYDDGLFHPDAGVTRAEMVKMLNRLLNRGPLIGLEQSSWKDVSVSHWAFGEIEEASRTHTAERLSAGGELELLH
jgi:hypothetical protein